MIDIGERAPRLLIFVVLCLAFAAVPAGAAKRKMPDLAVTNAHATGLDLVHVQFLTENKGKKSAKESVTGVYLSSDAKKSDDDHRLGGRGIPKLRPGETSTKSGGFAYPDSLEDGTYRVIVCADDKRDLKEKREANQCLTAPEPIPFGG